MSQKIDRDEDNVNITALPNLETKLVAANSLIPIERAPGRSLPQHQDRRKGSARCAMNARYFGARTAKTKARPARRISPGCATSWRSS